MVKYMIHNNDPIESDVDEIIVGNSSNGDVNADGIRYKKYVSTVDARTTYVFVNEYPRSEFPNLKIVQLCASYRVCSFVFGNQEDRKHLKYHLFYDQAADNISKFAELGYTYMLSLEGYRKYHESYPIFCSLALEEHEKEYFDKAVFLSFFDYDLSFRHNG